LLLPALALVFTSACGTSATTSRPAIVNSSAASKAAQDTKAYIAGCIPASSASATHWLAFGQSLLVKDGRKKVVSCLAIPKAEQPAFEDALLSAAEKVKWGSKPSRDTFVTVTFPALAEKYHGKS
jgi:hypothetical protein